MSFASVYPHYVTKAERKGKTSSDINTIIYWLTGYNEGELQFHIDNKTDLFSSHIHPLLKLVCKGNAGKGFTVFI